ncbi:MAG: Crp/Fnr family transcriptional regulator [Aestuariivirga sp.]|nr:Crp/Fnr family transcriptional regulator [Aestuariivirga sp.]
MRRTGWLSRTPEEFSSRLLQNCKLLSFPADQLVYDIDDPPGGVYGLAAGRVGVWIAPQERGPYLGHLMRPGQWFGVVSGAMRQSRAIGLRTVRPSQILLLPMVNLDALVNKDTKAWRYFTGLAEMNSSIAMAAVDDLLIRNPARRCAAVLLRLAGLRNPVDKTPAVGDVDVTQEELAHLSNLSRSSVGTALRSFQRSGLVDLSYQGIFIRDATSLKAFVAEDDSG